MTSQHGIEALRADVPALEPDAVLLAQLVELSSASAPSSTTSRASSMKVLLAAAGVAVVATTTWAAGAVPGHPFLPRPAHHPNTVVSPSASPSGEPAVRTPGASNPTSKAPGSIHPTPDGPSRGAAPGAAPTVQGAGTPRPTKHTGAAAQRPDHHRRHDSDGWRSGHRGHDSGAAWDGGRPDARTHDGSGFGEGWRHGDQYGDTHDDTHGDTHGDGDRDTHGDRHGGREAGPP